MIMIAIDRLGMHGLQTLFSGNRTPVDTLSNVLNMHTLLYNMTRAMIYKAYDYDNLYLYNTNSVCVSVCQV